MACILWDSIMPAVEVGGLGMYLGVGVCRAGGKLGLIGMKCG